MPEPPRPLQRWNAPWLVWKIPAARHELFAGFAQVSEGAVPFGLASRPNPDPGIIGNHDCVQFQRRLILRAARASQHTVQSEQQSLENRAAYNIQGRSPGSAGVAVVV